MVRASQIKEMLEKAFIQRTQDVNDKSSAKELPDFQTVHEAYQFMLMKYVERDVDPFYLTPDQIERKAGFLKKADKGNQVSCCCCCAWL